MAAKAEFTAYESLSDLLHSIVKRRGPGGASNAMRIAELLGVRYYTFMAQLDGRDGHKLGVDQLVPFMVHSGSLEPLHYLAERMGCMVLDLPKAGTFDSSCERQLLEAAREMGELIGAYNDAMADMRITAEELATIRHEAYQTMARVMGLLQLLEARP